MNSKQALVVDDSRSARKVLERMLQKADLNVTTVEDAESALAYLRDNQPNIIFMDHMMPGMDGLEATQALRQEPHLSEVPTIMYTSKDDADYLAAAKASGANDVLPKPAKQDKLEALISLYLSEMSAAASEDAPVEAASNDQVNGISQLELDKVQQDIAGQLQVLEAKVLRLVSDHSTQSIKNTQQAIKQAQPAPEALFKQMQPLTQRLSIQIAQKVVQQQQGKVKQAVTEVQNQVSELTAQQAQQITDLKSALEQSKRLAYLGITVGLLACAGMAASFFL